MNNQDKILLIYLNNNSEYMVNDMLELLGYTYKQLYNKLQDLVRDNYINVQEDGAIEISEKGFQWLYDSNLDNVEIESLISIKNIKKIFIKQPKSINKIYIPKEFEKKFTMYYNVDN